MGEDVVYAIHLAVNLELDGYVQARHIQRNACGAEKHELELRINCELRGGESREDSDSCLLCDSSGAVLLVDCHL